MQTLLETFQEWGVSISEWTEYFMHTLKLAIAHRRLLLRDISREQEVLPCTWLSQQINKKIWQLCDNCQVPHSIWGHYVQDHCLCKRFIKFQGWCEPDGNSSTEDVFTSPCLNSDGPRNGESLGAQSGREDRRTGKEREKRQQWA